MVFQPFNVKLQFDSNVGVEGRLTMRILLTAVSGALLALGCASSADAAVRVGTLRCIGAPRVGAIVASVQHARCVFTGVSGRHERYVAQFGRIGADMALRTGRNSSGTCTRRRL
jgi:hypothetical protein